jgi:hypothetical protein
MSIISASTATNTAYKVTADTTGTLVLQTGASPTTAVTIDGSQVVTFAKQPAGTFAGTGPAFSAYSSNAQSINSGVTAKIQLNVEVFDTNSNFDPTTNYRFQPTVAGYYQINGQLAFNGGATGYAKPILYKTGSPYVEGTSVPNNTITGAECSVSSLIYLNGSTDYVELYCYLYTGATALSLQNSSALNYLNGALVRAA